MFCTSNGELQVKLTDFGLSRTFMPGEMIESSCGSLEYSAPEILLGDSYDPPKVGQYNDPSVPLVCVSLLVKLQFVVLMSHTSSWGQCWHGRCCRVHS